MRALILTLRLSKAPEKYVKQFAEFELKLAADQIATGAERIYWSPLGGGAYAEYMVPWVGVPAEAAIKWRLKELFPPPDHWEVRPMIGEPACSDHWQSPLQRWVDKNLRGGVGWKPRKSNNVPLTQRRQPGAKSAI